MSDLRTGSKKFVAEFLEVYRSFPCLWKTKSKDYVNRSKKHEAYKALVTKLQEFEPEATKQSVKTKINSMRGGFRREYKKVLEAKRTGEFYKPNLWYFDLLTFVKDQDLPDDESAINGGCYCGNATNDDESMEHEDKYFENTDFQVKVEDSMDNVIGLEGDILSEPESPPEKILPTIKKRKRTEGIGISLADEVLGLVGKRLLSNENDQFDMFGKHVAVKLKNLSKETRLYTERLINEILFHAEMGNINRLAEVITHPVENYLPKT